MNKRYRISYSAPTPVKPRTVHPCKVRAKERIYYWLNENVGDICITNTHKHKHIFAQKKNTTLQYQEQKQIASVQIHNVRCISLLPHIDHKLFVRCALVLSDAVQQRRRLLKVLFDDVLEDLVPQCVRVV